MSDSAVLHPSIVHQHEGSREHEDHGHVHFPEGLGANTEIQVTHTDEKTVHIHLGFLKINHKYQVECKVPGILGDGTINTSQDSPHITITKLNYVKEEGKYELAFELFAHKDGLQRDKFHMCGEDREIAVVIHSRVMKRNKGTPMLKESIKCIGVSTDDESEGSDWQGFDKE